MEYFIEVDRSAVMRAAHQSEPFVSMSQFGLTADEQDALMSGEFGRVAGAIGIDAGKAQLSVMLVPQTIAMSNQLPALVIPQTVAIFEQ